MPNYFLDTSALAKRYHKESGSEYMDRIIEQPGSRLLISHLSIVELESVLAIKTRTGEIDEQALLIARRRFRADIARQRLLVAPPVHERHFHSARKLLIQYGVAEGVRTLDALQLAIALDLRQLGQVEALVAADQRLCRVASMVGCQAVNPEKPGPLLAQS
ncbi:MAG TPA: type II toxin-antitoxin system VapC family toxin [Bryobacteraceae bacterium]|nr:type II toxin-antitoxin system VapC family toxin [Bryobacteraceae bacterium]